MIIIEAIFHATQKKKKNHNKSVISIQFDLRTFVNVAYSLFFIRALYHKQS